MAFAGSLDALAAPCVSDELARLAQRLRRSTVAVHGRGSSGCGIIWRADGLVVTNAHVATRDRMSVTLEDGRRYTGAVVLRVGRRDLAVLRVDASGLPPAPIGDSARLRPGELVFAVGNPHGVQGAVTAGIVHSVGTGRQAWIEADISLGPGSSGGPLADARGRVVGVNSMVAHGLGLAIPSAAIERHLISRSPRPSLGVTCAPVSLRAGHNGTGGLLVLEVEEPSAAQAAGLMIGDILQSAGGVPLRAADDLIDVLGKAANRSSMEAEILRGGKAARMTIEFSTAPADIETAA
ncbi:MAG: S1C family serine protease [Candidatus Eremiobacteraeota bacterium]|nr:S1C family serine protease [Candidatus Eremiobacteraeota bacterium]